MSLVLPLLVVAVLVAAYQASRYPARFVVFLLAAGTLHFSSDIGEATTVVKDLSAIWLLCLILLSGLAILRSRALDFKLSPPEIAYALFLAWCLYEATRTGSMLFAGRMFLKLLYVFLVMILARHAGRFVAIAQLALKRTLAATAAAYLLVGGITFRFAIFITFAASSLLWAFAAFADHAAILTILALSCWRWKRTPGYLLLTLALATHSILASTRTGIVATAVGVTVFSLLEWRYRAVPFILAGYVGAMVALATVPEFSKRMFFDSNHLNAKQLVLAPYECDVSNIDSSGRFALWQRVLKKFFWPDPLFGSGLGATQHWFYTSGESTISVEHSEYVRLLSDVGVVGLALYLIVMAFAMAAAWQAYCSAATPLTRYCAMAAFSSIPAFLVCMGFDNVLNYVLPAGQYPLAFTGLAIGLQRAEAARSHARRSLEPGNSFAAIANPR